MTLTLHALDENGNDNWKQNKKKVQHKALAVPRRVQSSNTKQARHLLEPIKNSVTPKYNKPNVSCTSAAQPNNNLHTLMEWKQ